MKYIIGIFPILLFSITCSSIGLSQGRAPSGDEFQWLEEIQSAQSMAWVGERNQITLRELQADSRFSLFEMQAERIMTAPDRIPSVMSRAGKIYNFWQDDQHIRGVWRRTTWTEFVKERPNWEILLDLDELARREREEWVFKGAVCLAPQYTRCMLGLSRGGKDATVLREFDVNSKNFVRDGFVLPEAKSYVDWVDQDTLMVGTDFGPGTLTESGYPRMVKVWRRSESLSSAQWVFAGEKSDMSVGVERYPQSDRELIVLTRYLSRYESKKYLLLGLKDLVPIPVPDDADVSEYFDGRLLINLRSDGVVGGRRFKTGSLIALPLLTGGGTSFGEPEMVFEPSQSRFLGGVFSTKRELLITVREDVSSRLIRQVRRGDKGWQGKELQLPSKGSVRVISPDPFATDWLYSFESFIEPTRLVRVEGSRQRILKRLPARFNSRDIQVTQEFAVSRDGTRIPYYLIGSKRKLSDGKPTPTLLYGYGGFEIPMLPYYLGVWGKLWLERGGVIAYANIRGGGEYGPAWHQAALKHNRQKAFDDFISIAEKLVADRISSPEKLGIMGGSNGGLLVGAVTMQRPELFGAVVCSVPLLDMLRYTKLLAGASWIGEFGDPDIPEDRAVLEKYSPYHNINEKQNYPRILFDTSTLDDRVHPGHARKMAAKMLSLGKDVLYYENTQGGHAGSANLKQKAFMTAIEFTYLSRTLGLP